MTNVLLAAIYIFGIVAMLAVAGCAQRIPCTVNDEDAFCTVETDHTMTARQYDAIRFMLDTIRGPEL